jgi:hypothetical protein
VVGLDSVGAEFAMVFVLKIDGFEAINRGF